MKFFEVLSNSSDCKARMGLIKTSHSIIETPVFMPVGTQATVKAVEQRELLEMNAGIILGNTYHLYLRPDTEILKLAGGIHRFMNWDKSVLTDSGGFQVFSLASLRKITEEGVKFSSHLDGSSHLFTPEKVIEIQRAIGSDIMMPLDECMPFPIEHNEAVKSLKITHSWEKRCLDHYNVTKPLYGLDQYLFSINQGSLFKDLRKESIEFLDSLDFAGNAIGGLSVGEKNEDFYEITDYCTDLMSKNKPRYLMGVGTPIDILECVEKGVDMFDCVLPTRNARHGRIFTSYGEINIKNAKYKKDFRSVDEECKTYTSENFSLAYLRHLFISGEILGMNLASIHNIGFFLNLMRQIRNAIKEDRFLSFKKEFLEKYYSNN